MKSDNKRIARNTLYLYIRMIISILLSLITSRYLLKALGITDFGIYNVVGGITAMIAFFQSALSNVNLRFFSFEIGKSDFKRLKEYFDVSLTLYIYLSIIVVILSETIGLWFLNTHLIIPNNRIVAANIVYQTTIIIFIFNLLIVPYNSLLMAFENMKLFAGLTLFRTFANLGIVGLLFLGKFDHLSFYSILLCGVNFILYLFYLYFAKRNYSSLVSYRYLWKVSIIKEIWPYIKWNLFGCVAWSLNSQGLNILINMFFSPAVNAARAIAYQVNSLATTFVSQMYTAFRPQIIKKYAGDEFSEYRSLLYSSSKYSFYLFLFASLPILINAQFLMHIWLGQVPAMATNFTLLVVLYSFVDLLNEPLWTAVQASGKLKKFQLYGNLIFASNFFISYLLLKRGMSAYTPMISLIVVRIIYLIAVLFMVADDIKISIMEYLKIVIIPVLSISIITAVPAIYIYNEFISGFYKCLLSTLFLSFYLVIAIYTLGFNPLERSVVKNIIFNKIFRRK